MKHTKVQVVTNDDGDVYGAVLEGKKLTRLGALRAIKREVDGWGISEDVEITVDQLEKADFWETTGGEYDGWIWWSDPDSKKYDYHSKRYLGEGWMYSY